MTPTETTTLADFLLARIAEDEADAKAADPYDRGHWRWVDPHERHIKQALVDERDTTVLPAALGDVYPSVGVAAHIARHDPARVLAECEAKRRIVALHAEAASHTLAHGAPTNHEARAGALADVIQLLAQAYVEHPEYNESWRP